MLIARIIVKLVLMAFVFTSVLSGCIVVERPYRGHHPDYDCHHCYIDHR